MKHKIYSEGLTEINYCQGSVWFGNKSWKLTLGENPALQIQHSYCIPETYELTNKALRKIKSIIDDMHFENLKKEYIEKNVTDGMSWSLSLTYTDGDTVSVMVYEKPVHGDQALYDFFGAFPYASKPELLKIRMNVDKYEGDYNFKTINFVGLIISSDYITFDLHTKTIIIEETLKLNDVVYGESNCGKVKHIYEDISFQNSIDWVNFFYHVNQMTREDENSARLPEKPEGTYYTLWAEYYDGRKTEHIGKYTLENDDLKSIIHQVNNLLFGSVYCDKKSRYMFQCLMDEEWLKKGFRLL